MVFTTRGCFKSDCESYMTHLAQNVMTNKQQGMTSTGIVDGRMADLKRFRWASTSRTLAGYSLCRAVADDGSKGGDAHNNKDVKTHILHLFIQSLY